MAFSSGSTVASELLEQVMEATKNSKRCNKYCNDLHALLKELQPVVDYAVCQISQSNFDNPFKSPRSPVHDWLDELEGTLKRGAVEVNKCINPDFNAFSRHKTGKRILDVTESVNKLLQQAGLVGLAVTWTRELIVNEDTHELTGIKQVAQSVFGLDNFTMRLQQSVTSSSIDAQPRCVGVWGMGGAGKTLLAQIAYNSREVCEHFKGGKLVWLTVSQTPNIKGLYDSFCRQLGLRPMSFAQLEEYRTRLYNEFSRRRVFLVLDDVWNKGVLEQLDLAKGRGSVTLVTTRIKVVLEEAGVMDEDEVKVGVLSKEDSWKLFWVHAFPRGFRNIPSQLYGVIELVAEECKGLPLAHKVIGGSMVGKTSREEWEFQLNCLRESRNLPEEQEEALFGHLKLSYDYLDNLGPVIKKCFLGFAAFPEGRTVEMEELINFWKALGLLGDPTKMFGDDPTQFAYYFVGVLTGCSLIEVVQTDYSVACKVHDVMRHLALHIIEGQKPRTCLYRPGKELNIRDWVRTEEFRDWIRTYENDELDQVQLNEELCRYLDNVLVDIRINLDDPGKDLSTSKRDDRERALKELDLEVKRAESLIRKCKCKGSSWLDTAITLANIKEEILEIQLELSWWANMVEIASVQDLDSGESVVQNAVKAMRKQSALLEFLVKEGSSLQRAAEVDKEDLVSKLLRVKEEHAKEEDHEYVLSVYLLSQMTEDIHIVEMVRSKLNYVKWGKPLGKGTYGLVNEVTWFQRECAVKTVKSYEKEVKTLSRCNHPHIVQFLWHWEEQSQAYIIMERMSQNLENHIEFQAEKRGGQPFELHVAIDIMLQVAKAMQYLHKKKIVHRDLKTSNILVDDSTEGYVLVKLADFGLAKTYDRTQTVSTQTIGGTTRYAAPEVNLVDGAMIHGTNTQKFLRKADVWSFAMVCSEILTGNIPFTDMDVKQSEIHDKIAEPNFRPRLPNDSCFDYLRFCITSCWSHDQEKRPDFSTICQMLKLAKMLSLGVTSFDTCKSLFSRNPPIWMDPKNEDLEIR